MARGPWARETRRMLTRSAFSRCSAALFVVAPLAVVAACSIVTSTPTGTDASVAPDTGIVPLVDSGALSDVATASDAAADVALFDSAVACTTAQAFAAAEDVSTFSNQGVPDGHSCSGAELSVDANKYANGRLLLKFNLDAAAATKLAAGAVQNLRLRVTLSAASANAGMTPCLIGPPGNQINNCKFAFSACPMISSWTEAPESACATASFKNPETSTSWPNGTFATTCASGALIDFATPAPHADEVVEIPLTAAVVAPFVTGTTVSLTMPPLASNSSFKIHGHEAADPTKRPQLLFTCNP